MARAPLQRGLMEIVAASPSQTGPPSNAGCQRDSAILLAPGPGAGHVTSNGTAVNHSLTSSTAALAVQPASFEKQQFSRSGPSFSPLDLIVQPDPSLVLRRRRPLAAGPARRSLRPIAQVQQQGHRCS